MAKNLTTRATLAVVTIRGRQPETFVFTTKQAMEAYLFGLAVSNWSQSHGVNPMPVTRKATMEQFFRAGNSYTCSTVTLVSNEAAAKAGEKAAAKTGGGKKQKTETAGRSR
jgi:hypothetical protein